MDLDLFHNDLRPKQQAVIKDNQQIIMAITQETENEGTILHDCYHNI